MPLFKPRCAALLTVVFDGRTTSATDNSDPQHIVIEPREASVLLNGYHEADTWTLEFDARQLPFDPDSIAACNVRIFMWDDTDGFLGSRLDELVAIVGLDDFGPILDRRLGSFEMIRGICDEDEGVMVGEDNSVKLSGRDYTAILMARDWDTKKSIKNGFPLDEVVQAIADEAAPSSSAARFEVSWESEPGRSNPSKIPGCGSVHRKAKKEKGLHIKGEKTNWDVIYDLVLQHGFIVYVRGSTIVITDPATQTEETLTSAPTLIYGKHLDSLSCKRKFGKERVPQIILTAHDSDTDTDIEVIYPIKSNVIVDGLAVKKNEQMFLPAPAGMIDREAMMRYARIMFYYKGRAETVYEFKTHCLSLTNEVTGGVGMDMLKLRTGMALGVKFDPFNREHLRKLSVSERVQHIRAMGYSSSVAQFAALNIDKLTQYEQPYYLGAAKFDFSIDQGLEIEVTAYNFASQHRAIHFAEGPSRDNSLFDEQLKATDREETGVRNPSPGIIMNAEGGGTTVADDQVDAEEDFAE